MADATTTVATLRDAVRRFAEERHWGPFHSPKNLSMGLAVEAAELMEHFLWIESDASRQAVQDPQRLQAIAEEVADVAVHVLNLCIVLGLDLSDAVHAKLVKNAIKYPAPTPTTDTGQQSNIC
jgi:dCTP diphosphatase